MRYVAAFRAYEWNETISTLAARFFAGCPNARKIVLLDETNGPIDIGDYEKISHTEDTTLLGLPVYPAGKSLWYNCDYGFYILRQKIPGYDYYVFSESDLSVNLALESIVEDVAAQKIDVVCHGIMPSTPDWYWHPNGIQIFAEPWRSLLFFTIMSARTIEYLYQARLALANKLTTVPSHETWPFCEVFVPTLLKQRADLSIADLKTYAITEHLNFRPRLSINDPRANIPGSLAHSVVGVEFFLTELAASQTVRDSLIPNSPLHEVLKHEPILDYSSVLETLLEQADDRVGLMTLRKMMNTDAKPFSDLSLGKPAISSSISPWSRHQDRERDAQGANAATIQDDYGFHTHQQNDPWWMVDLIEPCAVYQLLIVNRRAFHERFLRFQVESSNDAMAWAQRFIKIDLQPVSSDIDQPWCQTFSEPFIARYVKISILGTGMLHLRRIQFLGYNLI